MSSVARLKALDIIDCAASKSLLFSNPYLPYHTQTIHASRFPLRRNQIFLNPKITDDEMLPIGRVFAHVESEQLLNHIRFAQFDRV